MILPRKPNSENLRRFLATEILNRVPSIQKFFSSGCVRFTPTPPRVLSNEFVEIVPYASEMFPNKSYVSPHGSTPSSAVVKVFASLSEDGLGSLVLGSMPPPERLKLCT